MQNFHHNKNIVTEEDGDHRRSGNTKILSKSTIRNRGKIRPNPTLRTDHSKDKELINCGLQKLVSSLAMVQKSGRKPSKMATHLKTMDDEESPVLEATNKQAESHIVLTDKYTMTDLEERYRRVEQESTVLKEQQSYKDLQWRDPRLLKKYSMVKQRYKKALTIPCVDKEALDGDSEDETDLISSKNNHFIFKCFYYFSTTFGSFVGYMTGITLITFLMSRVLNENMFTFYTEPTMHETLIGRAMLTLWGYVSKVVTVTLERIWRLLTISTSEAFAQKEDTPSAQSWLSKFY